MKIIDFSWSLRHVDWEYNGKKILVELPNITFAYYNMDHKYIYVACGENFIENQLYYLSSDGLELLTIDKLSGNISWGHNGQRVNIKSLDNAMPYFDEEIIMISTLDNKLFGYSLNGLLLFETAVPHDYRPWYFSTAEKRPTIVCTGNPEHADKSGRNDWHFLIDTKNGELTRYGIAY